MDLDLEPRASKGERGKPDLLTAPLQRASYEAYTEKAVPNISFPLLDRERHLSRMKLVLIPVIRGQTCINLTQTGLKPVGFMQTPHTPRPRIMALDICIGEEFHKPSPQGGLAPKTREASSSP